jgi:hypothetical protein
MCAKIPKPYQSLGCTKSPESLRACATSPRGHDMDLGVESTASSGPFLIDPFPFQICLSLTRQQWQ